MKGSLLIAICVRGGSKGIPGKNIISIAGRPLLAYTIDTAIRLKAALPDVHIALSTDSAAIREVAAHHGLSTDYARPDYLATDTAGKMDVWRDLLAHEEARCGGRFDYFLDMDVTSPLRTTADILASFEILDENPAALNVYSVNHAARNPYFNMVEHTDGRYRLVKENGGRYLTRQSAPPVYDLNASFYLFHRAFFDEQVTSPINDRGLVYVMPHMCFDLDHPVDFEFMSFLLEQNKLGFTL